jgi:hypothetical protein
MHEVAVIFLAGGKAVAVVDADDWERLSRHRWRLSKGHAITDIGSTTVSMHRMIVGAREGQVVDHRNRQRLDNRKENLRRCTHEENNLNTSPRGQASRYRGVWMSKGKWRAAITRHGRRQYLGYWDTELQAAMAYDMAADRLHGRFAKLNILHR